MRKKLLFAYLWATISLLMTISSYLTWAKSCPDFTDAWGRIPESAPHSTVSPDGYTGMCAGDGIQFIGVFIICIVASLAFILVGRIVLRVLKLKIVPK